MTAEVRCKHSGKLIPNIVDLYDEDERRLVATDSLGNVYRIPCGDIFPIVIPAGWKVSTLAPFRATHPAYVDAV